MTKPIATIEQTKRIMESYDAFTKKNYGQNFIIEPRVVEKIAQAALPEPATCIEVGPGIGALTQCLLARSTHLTCYEIDPRLPKVLRQELGDDFDIIEQDFLKASLVSDKPVVFCSNLPYYITTPILFKLFESDLSFINITVMMQKEVGQRFMAKANDAQYNALSVIWQASFTVKKIMDVSRHVFWPKPRVDSVVLQFVPNGRRYTPAFIEFVKTCFKQRRKTLVNNLRELFESTTVLAALERLGYDGAIRAQACQLDDFVAIYEELYANLSARQN